MNPNIEELLNGFIDGELSAEETAQVERILKEDASAATLLRRLEQCRMLVSSLPPAEPPAQVVSQIKELLQSKSVDKLRGTGQKRGARHLFVRHVLAASIIIGLLGIMAAVVYQITAPPGKTSPTIAVQPKLTATPQPTPVKEAQPVAKTDDSAGIGIYSLQLATADYTGVDAFVNKLLDESTWLKYEANKEPAQRSVYKVICSRTGLDTLVTDLSAVWAKFDSATLVVHTDNAGQFVAVDSVRPEQITNIVNQNSYDQRIRLAKDFAASNNLEKSQPDNQLAAKTNSDNPELMPIPRPVLTSGEKRVAPVPENPADRVRVDLTIILSGPASSAQRGEHK